MIRFTCPNCQSQLNAKDKLAGQSRKCPKCGADVSIPEAEARSDVAVDAETGAPTDAVPKIEVIREGLPRFEGPKRLVRTNRYLICDRASVFAFWWSDGAGRRAKHKRGAD